MTDVARIRGPSAFAETMQLILAAGSDRRLQVKEQEL